MKSIYNMSLSDLENYFLNLGEKKFKATQVFEWIYQKKVKSFSEMTNLKKDIRDQLEKDFYFEDITITKEEKDADVRKFLFSLSDLEKVEAVVMYHNYGNSLCISTQVGCNMGCKFCESGRLKKVRNLTTSELVLQILKIEEYLKEFDSIKNHEITLIKYGAYYQLHLFLELDSKLSLRRVTNLERKLKSSILRHRSLNVKYVSIYVTNDLDKD